MYAGFWLRVGATAIDGIILIIVDVLIGLILYGTALHCGIVEQHIYQNGEWTTGSVQQCTTSNGLLSFAYYWLYFTLLESSKWQATIGKKLLKLKVTDEAGAPIGFGKASVRYWSKILSGVILFIGFVMVGFTEKKQGLHDKIAKTLVVRN